MFPDRVAGRPGIADSHLGADRGQTARGLLPPNSILARGNGIAGVPCTRLRFIPAPFLLYGPVGLGHADFDPGDWFHLHTMMFLHSG